MGAICWQVVHQNSKNSTNCSPPEAILTVVGSVASRLGPREVAMGSVVGASVSAGKAETVSVGSWVGADAVVVTSIPAVAKGSGGTVAFPEAHEARKTVSRLRRRQVRSFISIRVLISKNPYERITPDRNWLQHRHFDGSKILRYTSLVDLCCGRSVFLLVLTTHTELQTI